MFTKVGLHVELSLFYFNFGTYLEPATAILEKVVSKQVAVVSRPTDSSVNMVILLPKLLYPNFQLILSYLNE